MTWMEKQKRVFLAVSGLFGIVASTGCVGSETIMQILPDNRETNTDPSGFSSDEEYTTAGDSEDVEGNYWGDSSDCGDVVLETEELLIDDPHLLNAMWGVTHFRGDLKISDVSVDAEGMAALESLRCVDGDLYLFEIRNLSNLSALSNLHSVGGNLIISRNDVLVDLDALNRLHWVGGDLVIEGNDDLSGLDGITEIRNLGGDRLYVAQNSKLPMCDATSLVDALNWQGTTCIKNNSQDACETIDDDCSMKSYWYP